jgi:hypothetical protein
MQLTPVHDGLPVAVFTVVLVVAHAFGTLLARPTRQAVPRHARQGK